MITKYLIFYIINDFAAIVDVLSDKLCGSKFYVPKPHILYIIGKI